MHNIRQIRKKQTSLRQHPSTSLHFIQINKLIEQYLHSQQRYLINLSAAVVQSHLPVRQISSIQTSFQVDLNVPFVQSEHYDSKETFHEQSLGFHQQSQEENFTQKQQSSVQEDFGVQIKNRRKEVQLSDDEFTQQDLKFIKHNKSIKDSQASKQSKGSFPFNSTKIDEESERRGTFNTEHDQFQLHHLQQTAYFLQEKERLERKLLFESQQQSKNNQNISSMNRPSIPEGTKPINSKKAIFLNIIEKQRTRKQIAQQINKQRHHLKKYLK